LTSADAVPAVLGISHRHSSGTGPSFERDPLWTVSRILRGHLVSN
jgi:hypothetical protein